MPHHVALTMHPHAQAEGFSEKISSELSAMESRLNDSVLQRSEEQKKAESVVEEVKQEIKTTKAESARQIQELRAEYASIVLPSHASLPTRASLCKGAKNP